MARLPQRLKPGIKSIVIDSEAVAWDKESKKILPFQVCVGGGGGGCWGLGPLLGLTGLTGLTGLMGLMGLMGLLRVDGCATQHRHTASR